MQHSYHGPIFYDVMHSKSKASPLLPSRCQGGEEVQNEQEHYTLVTCMMVVGQLLL
jgi:hypothetical protein